VEDWTGLNKENFSQLLNPYGSEKRHTECAFAIYLAKLRARMVIIANFEQL